MTAAGEQTSLNKYSSEPTVLFEQKVKVNFTGFLLLFWFCCCFFLVFFVFFFFFFLFFYVFDF